MMDAALIAPCGLDCALCERFLQTQNPCRGCNGPEEFKPNCCRIHCAIVRCNGRGEDAFCDACGRYPCGDILEKEIRYSNAYPMVETPVGNLAFIRNHGMERFLKAERARWACPDCGGIICVHSGRCSGCGAVFTSRRPARADAEN